jgi:hypothetical protein
LFSVEDQLSKKPECSRWLGLKMEVIRSSKMLVHIRTTQHYIQEGGNIQEIHNSCSSSNVIKMIKSGKTRLPRHVACIREKGMHIGL